MRPGSAAYCRVHGPKSGMGWQPWPAERRHLSNCGVAAHSNARAKGVAFLKRVEFFRRYQRNRKREGRVNRQRRNFLFLVTLIAPMVTLGLQQTATSATSIPDFSGIWAHGSIPGFEPKSSGPTSLVNRARRDGVGDILKLVGDYTNPILKPEAAEVVKKFGEMSMVNVGFPSPRNQCWPNGVPFVFTGGAIEILQQRDKITILYNYDHQLRRIRMNQTHPARVT